MPKKKRYVIVRCREAGVHAGVLISRKGREVVLGTSRRIWYWDGAASLSQLAVDGASVPENCKFAVPVERIELLEACEVIDCTAKAEKMIRTCPTWKR